MAEQLVYEAYCATCGGVTDHQFGTCLACSGNFPRPAVVVSEPDGRALRAACRVADGRKRRRSA